MAAQQPVPGRSYGRAGLSKEDWLGDEQADEAAKAQARAVDISPMMLSRWAEKQAAVEAVWRLIAESQVSRLGGRPRRYDGSAVAEGPCKARPRHPQANAGTKAGRAAGRSS